MAKERRIDDDDELYAYLGEMMERGGEIDPKTGVPPAIPTVDTKRPNAFVVLAKVLMVAVVYGAILVFLVLIAAILWSASKAAWDAGTQVFG